MLKSFQRLGYFPNLNQIPQDIINYLRDDLKLSDDIDVGYDQSRTLYRHQKRIRAYFQVTAFDKQARHLISEAVSKSALVMDNPADLINVAIEMLVKDRYELPGFNSLNRLVCRLRTRVNHQLFSQVITQLDEKYLNYLDRLLENHPVHQRSPYNDLKKLPKKSTRNHLNDLLVHLAWLESLGDISPYLEKINPSKIQHWAAEAKSLDASEIKKITQPKRATLLLCLIYTNGVNTRDYLVTMFLKQMKKIHNKAKEKLEFIRQQLQEKVEAIVAVFANVLPFFADESPEAQWSQVKQILQAGGGVDHLLSECDAINAYRGNNHSPLLWQFYKSHRSSFFRLINAIGLESTSTDLTLIKAIQFLKDNAPKRGSWLSGEVDLSFVNRRHINLSKLNSALVDILNRYHVLELPTFWGKGTSAAADGTKYDLYEQNLLSEYHIRVRREVALLSVSAIPLIAMKPVIPLTVPYQDMRLRQRNGMKLLEQRSRSRKTNAAHRKKDSVPTSTKCGSELGLSGMVIKRKSLLNVVRHDKPKVLIGLNQKVHSQVQELRIFLSRTPRLSAKKGDLTHSGNKVEHGKPVQSPVVGKPTVREAFDCAGKGGWKKPRLLCNGADRD